MAFDLQQLYRQHPMLVLGAGGGGALALFYVLSQRGKSNQQVLPYIPGGWSNSSGGTVPGIVPGPSPEAPGPSFGCIPPFVFDPETNSCVIPRIEPGPNPDPCAPYDILGRRLPWPRPGCIGPPESPQGIPMYGKGGGSISTPVFGMSNYDYMRSWVDAQQRTKMHIGMRG